MSIKVQGLSSLLEILQDASRGVLSIDTLASKGKVFREAFSSTILDTRFIYMDAIREAYFREIKTIMVLLKEFLSTRYTIGSDVLVKSILGFYPIDESSGCILVKAKGILPVIGENMVRPGGVTCLEPDKALLLTLASLVTPLGTGLEALLSTE